MSVVKRRLIDGFLCAPERGQTRGLFEACEIPANRQCAGQQKDRPGGFRKILLLILSGVWMCALVLSYPSCILLFPFVLLGFILFRKSMPKGGVWIFTGTIVLIAALYVGRLLSYLEFRRVPSIVKEALRACGSHEFNAKDKFLYNGSHFLIMAGLCAATMLLSCLLVDRKSTRLNSSH